MRFSKMQWVRFVLLFLLVVTLHAQEITVNWHVFKRLPEKSHWMLEELPEELSTLIEAQIASRFL